MRRSTFLRNDVLITYLLCAFARFPEAKNPFLLTYYARAPGFLGLKTFLLNYYAGSPGFLGSAILFYLLTMLVRQVSWS